MILKLTSHQFFLYIREAYKLEAHHQMLRLEAVSYPNMKKGDRSRVEKHYNRIISPPREPSKGKVKLTWSILKKRAEKRKKAKGD